MAQPIAAVFLKLMVTLCVDCPHGVSITSCCSTVVLSGSLCLHHSCYQCLQGIFTISTILCPRCACCVLIKACTPHIRIQPAPQPLLFLASLLVFAMAACLLLFLACWVSAKGRSMGLLGLGLLGGLTLSAAAADQRGQKIRHYLATDAEIKSQGLLVGPPETRDWA